MCRTYSQKSVEEFARIDLRILCDKVRTCVFEFKNTRDIAWLDKILAVTKAYSQLWDDINSRAGNISELPDIERVTDDRFNELLRA